jgi:hypothetical protein
LPLVSLIMGRAAASLILTLIGITVWASDAPAHRATLRGLKALNVAVDQLGLEPKAEGLGDIDLKARIVVLLRKAGIAVDQSAREFLGLHVISVQEGKVPTESVFH